MGADDLNEEKMDELLRLMRAAVPDTSGMSDAGKVGFVYKFDYDPSASYEKLDVVKFGMSLWTPKGDTTGNPPPDQSQEGQENVEENEHWVLFLPGALGSEYVKKTDLAKAPTETTAGKAGISYPDGKTIFSDENGMLTGATAGKELTQEELEEQIANGDLEAGDVVYLTGKPAGTNGLLIVVDKELNEDSVHAIRNSAVAKAINAANALIAENQRLIAETQALRATLEGFGLGKICPVDVTDVTEANGMVLGAFEKNASLEGTFANQVDSKINSRAKINGKNDFSSGSQSCTKNDVEISKNAHENAQFIAKAQTNKYVNAVAGYGFYNAGWCGGFLYMDKDDRKLKFIDHTGLRYELNMSHIDTVN